MAPVLEPDGKATRFQSLALQSTSFGLGMYVSGADNYVHLFYLSNAESFISAPPNHNTSWWFSDQLDLDDSYPAHHVLVPQQNTCMAEPPPYTAVAQNGHISLGQSPIKPMDTSQDGDNTETNMDLSTLTANNVLETSQNSEDADDPYMDSSQNASSDSPSQSQNPFHPTRQSTPILGRRLQLPPLHQSSSVDAADTPMTDGHPQQRHPLPYVSLSLHSSLPPRLRPISTPFLQQDDNTHTTNSTENIGPFPIRSGRLPPLQSALNRQDQQRRVSIGSDGPNQLPGLRRKRKRKRTNTWHGERLGTEMIHTIQEVNTLGVVTE